MCNPSDRTQRAFANRGCTRTKNSAMRCRMSAEISMATNSRISNELSAHQIQSSETCPKPDPLTVTGQSSFYYLMLFAIRNRNEHKTYRLLGRATSGACHTGDSNSERGLRALSNPFRQRDSNLPA